jgi:hypothetical protein
VSQLGGTRQVSSADWATAVVDYLGLHHEVMGGDPAAAVEALVREPLRAGWWGGRNGVMLTGAEDRLLAAPRVAAGAVAEDGEDRMENGAGAPTTGWGGRCSSLCER